MRLLLFLSLIVFPLTAIPIFYLGWLLRHRGEVPLLFRGLMFFVPALFTVVAGALRARSTAGLILAPLSGGMGYVAFWAYVYIGIATYPECVS